MAQVSAIPQASTSAAPLKARKPKGASQKSAAATSKNARKPPLGKLLASSDKQTREDAVDHLLVFLSGRGQLDEADKQALEQDGQGVTVETQEDADEADWEKVKLPKAFQEEQLNILWQGCFYCMYMCDKPLPQQKLANQLAEPIVSVIENPRLKSRAARHKAALAYISTFWKTMVRELPGIDRHRMDKYYSLMRRVVYNTFVMLRKTDWNATAIETSNTIYTGSGGPLYLQNSKTPISIAYHIVDIYVDELEKSVTGLNEEEQASLPVPIVALVEALIAVLASVNNKAHFQKVVSNVFEPLLEKLQKDGDEPAAKRRRKAADESDDDDGEKENPLASGQPGSLRNDILRKMFEMGAKEDTDPVNRARLYKFANSHGLEEE